MALEPNEDLRSLAASYNLVHRYFHDLGGIQEGHYVTVNEGRAKAIAQAYEELEVESDSKYVGHCYDALRNELIEQWYWIISHGYHLEPWLQDGQPYADSAEMRKDVRENKHLYFFTGGEPHPYLNSKTHTGYTGNEMLRAVHDIFGHATEGYGFGARGEENAWIHHSMMFSRFAQMALTTETRGQNSWVNFGPNSHLPVADRPYADQKVDLLPSWCCDWMEALRG
jgi:hypothetical protein